MKKNCWSDMNLSHVIDYIEKVDGKIVLGIDGFIDQVWQVIETRTSKDEYKIVDKMKQFGETIVNRGGGGMANELMKKRRSCGGFTANTGRAIGNLSLSPVLLGMYGTDAIDPIFDEFKEKCTLITVGEPVISNVLEFSDGKIMMPYLKELLDFDWNKLISTLGNENLEKIFADADIVSLGYWSNMPGFDELIINIYENYLKEKSLKRIFFDFANIKKRSVEAIKETFNVLGDLNNKIPITLSLNEHEAVLLFSYFDEEITDDIEQVGIAAASIRERINLDEIIVHTPHYALATSKLEGTAFMMQDYCMNPVITTGAGDTFNGGYIASCLKDLSISERLAVSNATTRFYINNGFPPDRNQLIEEIKRLKEVLG